jgi:hypothetical protein
VDDNAAAVNFFSKAYGKGAASIQKDRNIPLKEASWGEGGNSDTLVGNHSDLFKLAIGYLKEGIYKSADDKKEAKQSISIANEELNELSGLVEDPFALEAISEQYKQFFEEVSGLGFQIENYLPEIKKRSKHLWGEYNGGKIGGSEGNRLPFDKSIDSVFNEFYSTAFNGLNYNHLLIGNGEAAQSKLAEKILDAYVSGLSALSGTLKTAKKEPSREPVDKSDNLTKIEEIFTQDALDLADFRSKIIRKLVDCREIPALNHYVAGKLGNYDEQYAWMILKNCIPGFDEAEDLGLDKISKNIDTAGHDLVGRAMNFANFGSGDTTPFAEKLRKSFSYINNRLK